MDQIQGLVEIFRLLGDSTRLRIILSCLGDPVSVGAIATALKIPQALVSHHLRLLKASRLVESERRGKYVFYSLFDKHIRRILSDLLDHIGEEKPIREGGVSEISPSKMPGSQ